MIKKLTLMLVALMIAATSFAQVNYAKRVSAKEQEKIMASERVMITPVAVQQTAVTATRSNSVISTFPYNEGFESGCSDWTLNDADADGNNWMLASTYGLDSSYIHAGQDCMLSCSYASYTALTPNNWMISSEIQLPVASNFELSWYDAAQDGSYPADHYAVYIATTNTVAGFTATTPVFETTLSTDAWTKRVVNLASYAGQNIYVAFRHYNCTDQFVMKIDDIYVGALQPADVTITGSATAFKDEAATFTAVCSDTTATFAWTVDGASVTETSTVLTHTFTTAGAHTVGVSATNTVGTSTVSFAVNVLDCSAITTLPWVETFADGLGCWNVVDNNNDGTTWNIYEGYGVYISYSTTGNDDYIISQAITIPATGTNILSWEALALSSSYPESYEVLISTTGRESISNFTSVFSETYSLTTFEKRSFDLVNYAGQTINVAFRNISVDQYALFINNIRIGAPETPTVTLDGPATAIVGNVATYTATSADAESFAWTVDGASVAETSAVLTHTFTTAGIHTIMVTATNVAGSGTATLDVVAISCDAINQFPYTMGFEDDQVTDCWTFLDNDGDGYGWDASTFAESDYTYEGTGVVGSASYENYVGALTPDNWMITPAIILPSNGSANISWYVGAVDPSYYQESYSVLVSTTGTNVADFTNTLYTGTLSSADFTQISKSLNSFLGQTIYIAFRHHNSTDMYWILIDNIEITADGTQVDENLANGVNIYPNPTTGMVYVNAENAQEIQVLDINGRVVMSQNEVNEINISELSNGVYMVRVITNEGVSMQKIVKE